MYLQENVAEENVVVMIAEFAGLVDMTDDTIDQSRRNFEVITNVLNATSSIVNNAALNDTDLRQVQSSEVAFVAFDHHMVIVSRLLSRCQV